MAMIDSFIAIGDRGLGIGMEKTPSPQPLIAGLLGSSFFHNQLFGQRNCAVEA